MSLKPLKIDIMPISEVLNCNNLEGMRKYADCFFDSCITDSPYGLKFMGKKWDYSVPEVVVWTEVYRVLKHGAHILVACGTRTQHRMACNIEDAGFEIRDVITWHYGSGFPKSLDISKAIDKQAGAKREIIGKNKAGKGSAVHLMNGDAKYGGEFDITAPETDEAKKWNGWGTALKPATEFWTLARKPLSEDTVAENVLKHGTGGINIDECRIGLTGATKRSEQADYPKNENGTEDRSGSWARTGHEVEELNKGRFPANLILDEFMGKELDKQSGISVSTSSDKRNGTNSKGNGGFVLADREEDLLRGHNDEGGASRFFYCPKSDNYERNKGLKGFDEKNKSHITTQNFENALTGSGNERNILHKNHHPTVKPIDLMRYLVKLITPKGGHVLDPYNGSGTTGIACKLEFMNYTGFEIDAEYCKISEARIAAWNPEKYVPQPLFPETQTENIKSKTEQTKLW